MAYSVLQLTGKIGYTNINNGHMAQDTVTINNVVSQPSRALSIPNFLFGCAEAYKQCTPSEPPNCLNTSTTCPAAGQSPAPLFQGLCPGSGQGIEAGWTFSFDDTAPSAIGVPQQVFQANLIKKQVVGLRTHDHTSIVSTSHHTLPHSCRSECHLTLCSKNVTLSL